MAFDIAVSVTTTAAGVVRDVPGVDPVGVTAPNRVVTLTFTMLDVSGGDPIGVAVGDATRTVAVGGVTLVVFARGLVGVVAAGAVLTLANVAFDAAVTTVGVLVDAVVAAAGGTAFERSGVGPMLLITVDATTLGAGIARDVSAAEVACTGLGRLTILVLYIAVSKAAIERLGTHSGFFALV